jgi:hypothetical protein
VTRILVGGGLITALLIGTAMLFTRYRRQTGTAEARESTYQEGRLASDLSDMLSSFLGRFRGHGRPGDAELEPVRRLYFEMLAAAEARGVQRLPAETPLDFSPRLERSFASQTPGEITQLFDDVRYGARDAPPEVVQRLRDNWQRLHNGET